MEKTKKPLIFLLILLIFGTIVSSIIINDLSKNNQIIPVNIVVENPNPSINESVSFRLILGNDYPFYISELAEGAGIRIYRIPDNIDPFTAYNNASFLENLPSSGAIGSVGLKDYSNDDKTLFLEWNCTTEQYNPLIDDKSSTYVRAPAGYYIIYRDDLNSYDNDNILEFRVSNRSIFHLDGLNPRMDSSYNLSNGSIDIEIDVASSIVGSDEAELSIGIYIRRDNNPSYEAAPLYNMIIAPETTVREHFSDIDIRDNDIIYVYASIHFEGHDYSLRSTHVIE